VLAGRGCAGAVSVVELGRHLGWPVVADPLSGLRANDDVVVGADLVLRTDALTGEFRPDLVVQFGAAPASKVLARWWTTDDVDRAVVGPGPELPDPGATADVVVQGEPEDVATRLVALTDGRGDSAWLQGWVAADHVVQSVLADHLGGRLTEPAVARSVIAESPAGAAVVVSSSMPIRDVEWFGPPGAGVTVYANRGANGIDGIISTAVGVALAGRPTIVLLGDLAFLHDSNGLLGVAGREVDLTVVVVDNDGGGIFSFLPQASVLSASSFEQVFGTPHGLDLVALAAAYGVTAMPVVSSDQLRGAVADPDGVTVAVVSSERATNVVHHEELYRAVADALTAG
jgi:2-succinyl-5-enolpyruvyl-6-hydroxy-3-cyclohexene-1-carboxylate synthase